MLFNVLDQYIWTLWWIGAIEMFEWYLYYFFALNWRYRNVWIVFVLFLCVELAL